MGCAAFLVHQFRWPHRQPTGDAGEAPPDDHGLDMVAVDRTFSALLRVRPKPSARVWVQLAKTAAWHQGACLTRAAYSCAAGEAVCTLHLPARPGHCASLILESSSFWTAWWLRAHCQVLRRSVRTTATSCPS